MTILTLNTIATVVMAVATACLFVATWLNLKATRRFRQQYEKTHREMMAAAAGFRALKLAYEARLAAVETIVYEGEPPHGPVVRH